MEGGITQDNHPFFELANAPLKRLVGHMGSGTVPRDDQPPLIQHQTQFAADNLTVIGETFPTDLLGAAAFAHGVDQCDPIGINDPQHCRRGQEDLSPILVCHEETTEPCPLKQAREQGTIVSRQPTIEGTIAHAFARM